MNENDNIYRPIPFWSWNDELDTKELVKQIEWMKESGIGGFFMHARGGLKEEYLGEHWFECVEECLKKAKELDMEAYAYDENGWPSGFVGGKLLDDINNHDMYLTTKRGEYDPKSVAAFLVDKNKLIKTTSGKDVLNVYTNYSTSTVDICDKDVVRKFINLTHEEYKKHDKYHNLRGFFTDEPQYYRWGTPFTKQLIPYFEKNYHEDVFERIGLLFEKKEGYEDYRYKYYKALQDLMLNHFGKQIYDWCDSNGYKLTGHYVEELSLGYQIMCCGGVMPFYEYEHIPGVDHLGKNVFTTHLSAKQLGSVISQLGKKQGLCEMFGCVGWDTTPLELKKIFNLYSVNGINVVCHHLIPYSEHGQRKRDYPEHYSKINPWADKNFKILNDEFFEKGKVISNSFEPANVGLFVPIRSAYFDYMRSLEAEGFGCAELDKSLAELNKKLGDYGVQYHMLDETIMAKHGFVKGNKLVVGKCEYEFLIIPEHTLTMDKTTEVLFRKFAKNGGKILVLGEKPPYLEGKHFDHDYLKSNTTFEEIVNAKPFKSSPNENLRISYRIDSKGNAFIYVVNVGSETDIEIKVDGYESFEDNGKLLSQSLHFDQSESKILYFSREKCVKSKKSDYIKLNKEFRLSESVTNYLTLDYLSYSTNGKDYSKCAYHLGVFYKLLKERYSGKLYLKYTFQVKSIPEVCDALVENMNTKEVFINSQKVNSKGYVLEKDLLAYDIASKLKEGLNELVVVIDFYESENVYYALFGENVLESIKNCLVYDTTLEAVYLRGNFGVYGNFTKGNDENVVLGHDFYLDKQPKNLTSLIENGFPFFRGNITLEQEIEVDSTNKTLLIDKRFQLIDLYVNDKFVKRMMLEYKVDLSKYLNVGKNRIKLVLTVSNRNLLGPFHFPIEEPAHVGPITFERFGLWNDDLTSEYFLPRYSFVKTII